MSVDCVFNEHNNNHGYSLFESRSHAGGYLMLSEGDDDTPCEQDREFLYPEENGSFEPFTILNPLHK